MHRAYAVVGPIASGKGTVVKILSEKGYMPYSLSDRIREEITQRGLEITRQNLNIVSNDLRKTLGSDILAKRTIDLIMKDNPELIVVDSVRNPEEVRLLKESLNAKVIGINAPQDKRYQMFVARGNNSAGIESFEQFKELDDKETEGDEAHSQRVGDSLRIADFVIENDGTIEELKEKINALLGS